MWSAEDGGRRLIFHLTGINNQNFLMQDEQTGSWWQQADGLAVLGPLKGHQLRPVFCDEVSFAVWRRERPGGRVLRPAADPSWRRFSGGWEAQTARLPVPREISAGGPLAPRALVLGLALGGEARAYPAEAIIRQGPVLDSLAGVPVVLLSGPEGRSVRAFEARLAGRPVTLFAATGQPGQPERVEGEAGGARPQPATPSPAGATGPAGSPSPVQSGWIDAETGSSWDFSGHAVSGPLAGRGLTPVAIQKDYWFDWKAYHPRTTVYQAGAPRE